jgi:hypothetical protein
VSRILRQLRRQLVLRQLVLRQLELQQLVQRLQQAQRQPGEQLVQVQQPGEQLEGLPVRGQQQVAQLEQQRELRQPELEPRLNLTLIQ